jgi:8-oxo-dGTP diphosphatase
MKAKIFCNFCNSPLQLRFIEGKERQICGACGEIYYENPLPVVSIMVANERREMLLVKRAREPSKDMWCFPIGFAESGESVEAAAIRELKEEAGIEGRIVQVLDVSSDSTPLYGEVLVVTFEAEKTGGTEVAGDDASDFGYFPVTNLPPLAFESQNRAFSRFIELKKDLWNMRDSFQRFVKGTLGEEALLAGTLLSDELIDVIESNARRIIELWIDDIQTNASTKGYVGFERKELSSRALYIIGQLRTWLKGGKTEGELKQFCQDLGRQRRKDGIAVEELLSSLSLLKRKVFRFTLGMGVWYKPVDLYKVFELGERLVGFFDRVAYYSVVGYNRSSKE